jgi:hypothetical protein
MPRTSTARIQSLTRRHRTALARLTNDALPPQTREDVIELAQTYHELLNEYIALQEAVGALVVG